MGLPRRKIEAAAKVVVSLAVVAAALSFVDKGKVFTAIGRLSIWSGALIWAVLLVGGVAQSARFYFLQRFLFRPEPVRQSFAKTFTAIWLNQLLPTGLGGDAVRVVLVKQRMGLRRSVLVALLDRLLGILVMFGVLFGLCLLRLVAGDGSAWTISGIVVGGGAVVAAGLLAALSQNRAVRRLLPRQFRGIAFVFLTLKRVALACISSPLPALAVVTSYLAYAIAFGLCLQFAEKAGTSFLALITLGTWVLILQQIPVSFGGWGLREGIAASLAPAFGVSAEAALAGAICYGLGVLLSAVPGAFAWMQVRFRNQSLLKSSLTPAPQAVQPSAGQGP